MIVKKGIVVSHSGAMEWGVGKIVELTDLRATIQFNDGIVRKISCSHYTVLQPADSALYISPEGCESVAKVRAPAKRTKKVKAVAVPVTL